MVLFGEGLRGQSYAEADFDHGPEDETLAVGVGFEICDAEDADYLNDCDEEAEGEEAG